MAEIDELASPTRSSTITVRIAGSAAASATTTLILVHRLPAAMRVEMQGRIGCVVRRVTGLEEDSDVNLPPLGEGHGDGGELDERGSEGEKEGYHL